MLIDGASRGGEPNLHDPLEQRHHTNQHHKLLLLLLLLLLKPWAASAEVSERKRHESAVIFTFDYIISANAMQIICLC